MINWILLPIILLYASWMFYRFWQKSKQGVCTSCPAARTCAGCCTTESSAIAKPDPTSTQVR